MINNIADLNKFVTSQGGVRPELIVHKLADSKILVSAAMARLLLKPSEYMLRDKGV